MTGPRRSHHRLGRRAGRFPMPALGSERARLTALCTLMLLLAGGALIALIYVLLGQGLYATIDGAVARIPSTKIEVSPSPRRGAGESTADTTPVPGPTPGASSDPTRDIELIERGPLPVTEAQSLAFIDDIRSAALNDLVVVSLIALAAFAAAAVAVAWWMAGRVLRPVRHVTETARLLSGTNLHERIALRAPPGELKVLADTFDEMLDRIQQLVNAQQRFAANAAHELRTPVALQRAAAEIGLAGDPDPQRVARIRTKLIKTSEQQGHLIEGLLLLATSEQGMRRLEPVDLHEVAHAVALAVGPEAADREVTPHLDLQPLRTTGDPVLLERLTHNLVSNAIRHNHPGGSVSVRTGAGRLEVSNTGPVIPTETVPLLFEPFRRIEERRHAPGDGVGLGLSIVAAIARAHGATAVATANVEGGLTIRVRFAADEPSGGGTGVRW
ncbi:HAMP domain-containing sensor histidine kinase [Streptomyces sp. NPDC094034]|uniref:sensor histidine kinase n=1 Tax=Streptomyces sp. NPDC094034 TaxID=3155309 RepID=UPI0033280F5F